MKDIFVISDTHFNHANILKFLKADGSRSRPEFKNVEEMNEVIIDNWNKTIKPDDIIYHLGDFTFGGAHNIAKIAPRLNGRKRIILGNHDYDAADFVGHFDKITSWRVFSKKDTFRKTVALCHYPLHWSACDRADINIHGHLHYQTVDDHRYVNVCVEHTNYKPVSIEEIIDAWDDR